MKDKLVICTVGTSIAQGCPSQRDFLNLKQNWSGQSQQLESEIAQRLANHEGDIRHLSAEINALDRLEISVDSKIILLATDHVAGKACSQQLAKFIVQHYQLAEDNVVVECIKDLQVHDAERLTKSGIKNLIKKVLEYVSNVNYTYAYDIILNPNGGYKAVLPFFTIIGMLYGLRSVYVFEFAEQLINLPPLPFSFNLDVYRRAKPALKLIEEESYIPEQQFYANIINFTEQEKPLFSSFVEFEEGQVTSSPLADIFLQLDKAENKPQVSTTIINELRHDNTTEGRRLKSLIKQSANPVWREANSESWSQTDLKVIKRLSTAERLAFYVENNQIHIAYAFRTHDEYARDLPKFSKATASQLTYQEWDITEDVNKIGDHDEEELLSDKVKLLEKYEELSQQFTEQTEVLKKADENIKYLHLQLEEQQAVEQQVNQQCTQQKQQLEIMQVEAARLQEQLRKQQEALPKTWLEKIRYVFK